VNEQRIKSNVNNPGCNVYFYIGDATGNTVLNVFSNTPSASLTASWREVTASYTSPAAGLAATFNVRLVCSVTPSTSRSYYFDEIMFTPA
jgi:hypothetical protein